MNETSATSQSGASLLPDGIGALTTVHLVLILLLAIAAVAIIVVGMRRKRVRREAEHQVEQRAEDAGLPPPTAEPAAPAAPPPPAPARSPVVAPPPAPAPVAPHEPTTLADEPIAAAAPLDTNPAAEAASDPTVEAPASPAPAGLADGPVTQLKGLGPKVAAALAERGITSVGQLAALSDAEAAALDGELGSFRGRMARDRWIEQARLLAAGDRVGFEAVFGKL